MSDIKIVCTALSFLNLLATICFMIFSLFGKDEKRLANRFYAYFVSTTFVFVYYFAQEALGAKLGIRLEHKIDFIIDFIVLILEVVFVWVLFKEYINKKNIVNKSTIEECFRNLPTGILFYYDDGLVLAANKIINDIALKLSGTTIINGVYFWNWLTNNFILNEHKQPIVMVDDKVYLFTRFSLNFDGNSLYELDCADVTELYALSLELNAKNHELDMLNNRLRIYNENVDDIIKQEEILATKMHIHDQLGHLIMSTRLALKSKDKLDDKLLQKWYDNTDLLAKDPVSNYNSKGEFQLKQAASAIGLNLTVKGDLPKDKKLYHLYISAARELLINAKKHGNANNMAIEIKRNEQYYIISFRNDGIVPNEQINLAGGLLSLKTRLEKEGGKLEIRYENAFEVVIYIIRKGDENV